MSKRVVVTGAFSYTGAAVAQELLRRGYTIHSLTNRRPVDEGSISFAPLRFEREHLKRELSDAHAFVNTYWVRLPYAGQSFASAVQNSQVLIDAAVSAGVKRIVHISVSNAEEGKNLGYYAGKAQVDAYVRRCGVPYSIVRPTLIVGAADVLTNNIAWLLRRFPVFFIPGKSAYRLQPITLDDTARIIADAIEQQDNQEVDAAGPDMFTFANYVELVATACHVKRIMIRFPERIIFATVQGIQSLLKDIILTREELLGLKQELLISHKPPLGKESIAEWLQIHGDQLGHQYANDVKRHFGQGRTKAILYVDKIGNLNIAKPS